MATTMQEILERYVHEHDSTHAVFAAMPDAHACIPSARALPELGAAGLARGHHAALLRGVRFSSSRRSQGGTSTAPGRPPRQRRWSRPSTTSTKRSSSPSARRTTPGSTR